MAAHQATAILTIANGGTTSGLLSAVWGSANAAKVALDHAVTITVQAPAVLTGTAKPEISVDGTNWVTLQSAGADVSLPAGKATVLPPFTARDFRIVSGSAEGADRAFLVNIQEEIGI